MVDYIVVGAGSAGCVVANRLTEDASTTVLLLEAGGADDQPEFRIPLAGWSLRGGEHDWKYVTEPQQHVNQKQVNWPRGKVLGGTSSINAMVYMRGHRALYDSWKAAGNTGWGYDDVLPYFIKSQHQERGADKYHGVGGLLNVADGRDPNPLSSAFVDAGIEAGYPRNYDFNGAEQEGVGYYQVTQKNGERWSTASAFLRPAMQRSNLTVITGAHVTQVVFRDKRATAVRYRLEGEIHEAVASREIVLCGGAINSPQLLLLSGIGPGSHLQAMGIPIIVDFPGVGQNLQDHVDVLVVYYCSQPISLGIARNVAELEYRHFRKGPFSSNGPEAGAFLKTRPDLPMPDLQFHFVPEWGVRYSTQPPEKHGFTFWPGLLLPESRGYLELRSPDPFAPPVIQPNYLACESDLEVLVKGVKVARQLAATKAFAALVESELQPGVEIQTDAAIREYIRANLATIYHPAGTCKMGIDDTAVVDSQLRVRGVEGLRVADASIMPLIVNGNTNAPCIMIGEKAADMIRA